MIEITLVVSPALFQQYPHSELAIQANYILRDSFLRRNLTNQSISYPPLRVFAALLALGANWTRYLCYRELGRQYTFQVAIIKDHKLITTGPYSIVRHPSYAAAFLKYISNFLWHASPGAWLWESRFYETKISWLFLAPSLLMFYLFVQIIMTRPQKEDELLKKEFGKKWEEWAEAVPYRLIPGVY